jgi:hypothetical protein
MCKDQVDLGAIITLSQAFLVVLRGNRVLISSSGFINASKSAHTQVLPFLKIGLMLSFHTPIISKL